MQTMRNSVFTFLIYLIERLLEKALSARSLKQPCPLFNPLLIVFLLEFQTHPHPHFSPVKLKQEVFRSTYSRVTCVKTELPGVVEDHRHEDGLQVVVYSLPAAEDDNAIPLAVVRDRSVAPGRRFLRQLVGKAVDQLLPV